MSDEFKLVSYKRRSNKKVIKPEITPDSTVIEHFNPETQLRRIESTKEEIRSSDLFDSVAASLREAQSTLGNPLIKEIICLGLGRIGECWISRYQFALLLCLKDIYKSITIKIYDPILTQNDCWILEHFNCIVLKENVEGKYKTNNNTTTIFYLPHCPKQLTNNLLWANWGLNLINCILISNSFQNILDNTPKKLLRTTGEFIMKISPYVIEFAVINSFKYFEIFNDTAIHVFPLKTIQLISEDLWNNCEEPKYNDDDLEYIRKS